eukprot:7630543-Ditylum_brightwellii.AAC.1
MDVQDFPYRHNTTTTPIIMTFDSYLNTLEPWDYLMLKKIVLKTSAHEIAQTCQTDVQINIASDSSSVEEENKMTFG